MFVLAAVLTAAISVDIDLTALLRRSQPKQDPAVTCNIHTVGYRFRGTPGQEFRYAGDTYTVPAEGAIELIADRRKTSYAYAGRTLPLDVWPRDQFGFRDIPLPSPDATKGENR